MFKSTVMGMTWCITFPYFLLVIVVIIIIDAYVWIFRVENDVGQKTPELYVLGKNIGIRAMRMISAVLQEYQLLVY